MALTTATVQNVGDGEAQNSTDQQFEQLSQVSNTSMSILEEQLSIMKQILSGVEILVANSK